MVLTMGEERASRIFALMDDEEIREISQNMVNLGAVDATVIESLLVEFVSMIAGTGTVQGTYESTERLLLKGLDKDRVGQIMEELRGPAGRTMWDCPSSKQLGLLSVFHKGGSGSSLFDVKPLGFDGSSGGFVWSVF